MAIRIRVYPQNGLGGAYGLNSGVGIAALYQSKLQAQKQISSLQLGYERALADEKIKNATLAARMQNPYGLMYGGLGMTGFPGYSMANPYATSLLGTSLVNSALTSGQGFFSNLGLGGLF